MTIATHAAGHGLPAFDLAALLVVLAAALGWINRRFLGLPQSVGLTAMGLLASLGLVAVDRLLPGGPVSRDLLRIVGHIDFHNTLMNGMLSFLLFSAAIQVDWRQLRRSRTAVLVLSTGSTLLSTAMVGFGLRFLSPLTGVAIPLAWCLVFGALISPTDPVAVTDALKRVDVDGRLRATVAGESLFNDGIGVVVFTMMLGAALSSTPLTWGEGIRLFAAQAGGGLLLGFIAGWLAYGAMRAIDDYQVEVMISLAIVTGGYALARALGVSGPVAMVVAGLIVGNKAVEHAMSDLTREHLLTFWSVVEELLNALLFLLIGLEVVTVPANWSLVAISLAAVPLVLLVRWASVRLPLALLGRFSNFGPLTTVVLVWGGLRGGISVALALGLPHGAQRGTVLAATYAVVLFAVVVQGGTFERMLRWRCGDRSPQDADEAWRDTVDGPFPEPSPE